MNVDIRTSSQYKYKSNGSNWRHKKGLLPLISLEFSFSIVVHYKTKCLSNFVVLRFKENFYSLLERSHEGSRKCYNFSPLIWINMKFLSWCVLLLLWAGHTMRFANRMCWLATLLKIHWCLCAIRFLCKRFFYWLVKNWFKTSYAKENNNL